MITYIVNTVVGTLYRGIPSYDVAVALAVDFDRYDINDVHQADEYDLQRHRVAVEQVEEDGIKYTLVHRTDDFDRGLSVGEEHRCEACRRPL